MGLGNELNGIVNRTFGAVFTQGELAQLAHTAFDHAARLIKEGDLDEITIEYPIGYHPTKQPMVGEQIYTREELIGRYSLLAHTQIPINGIYHLVTVVEAMLTDLIRRLVVAYPGKVGAKRHVPLKRVLEAQSLEEMRLAAVDGLLHDLSFKSPREFAGEVEKLLSVNLLECPAFHTYIEMKATRDVFIHNRGVANQTYLTKAGSHARVKEGAELPVSQIYFLEVYEACLQFIEWLEEQLHQVWYSSDYVARKGRSSPQLLEAGGDDEPNG